MIDFSTAIRAHIADYLSGVNTAIPVVVVAVESDGEVTVQPVVSVPLGDSNEVMPPIPNVPVMFPQSKNGGVSWQIEKGDTGIAIFMQQSIDDWLAGDGQDSKNSDPRKFDLTDAVFIPGLFPFSVAPKMPSGAELRYGDTSVTISKDGTVTIGGVGAQRMVNESFVSTYNFHTHPSSGSPPIPLMTDINLTTTKAV